MNRRVRLFFPAVLLTTLIFATVSAVVKSLASGMAGPIGLMQLKLMRKVRRLRRPVSWPPLLMWPR